MNKALTIFQDSKAIMFGIAYRMLGSASEADDVVQEAWLRWSNCEWQKVKSPSAFLSRIVTRLSIDQLRSSQKLREAYPGPWLPEPLITHSDENLNAEIQLQDLSLAMLLLLEKLNPVERAVFILKEAFDFSHKQIAQVLEIEVPYSRQLAKRAKQNLHKDRALFKTDRAQQKNLLERFAQCALEGDLEPLRQYLAEDAVAYTDGGGIVSAAIIPLEGRERIMTVFSHLLARQKTNTSSRLQLVEVNDGWGLYIEGAELEPSLITLATDGDHINQIYVQRNPEKLKNLQANLIA